jgi:hypothetical protein
MKNLKITEEAHFKLKTHCDINNLKMNAWISEKIIELLKNNIYVDINPRATGKTTRLIDDIIKKVEDGKSKIAVITHRKDSGELIKDKLIGNGIDINKYDIIFSNTMYLNSNDYIYYIDEFDYIDRDKLFIDKNSYYCGTLKNSEPDDFTKNLYNTFINSVLWKK